MSDIVTYQDIPNDMPFIICLEHARASTMNGKYVRCLVKSDHSMSQSIFMELPNNALAKRLNTLRIKDRYFPVMEFTLVKRHNQLKLLKIKEIRQDDHPHFEHTFKR